MPDTPAVRIGGTDEWTQASNLTMPNTLTPEELAAIRERDATMGDPTHASEDRRSLLAHIDALTAAVEGINTEAGEWDEERMRAAVLAILRGEQADPDAEAEAEFLKPIKPQGL